MTKDGSILTYLLDVENSGKTSEDVANSWKHSMGKLGIENAEDEKCDGQTTDSGGGGTLASPHQSLDENNLTNDLYFI
jgi:hypothetical protein